VRRGPGWDAAPPVPFCCIKCRKLTSRWDRRTLPPEAWRRHFNESMLSSHCVFRKSEEGLGGLRPHPSPLLVIPNVTARPSTFRARNNSFTNCHMTASVTLVSYLWRCERGFQLTKVPHLYIGLWGYSHDVVLDCLMWAVSYDELEVHCTEDWNVARVANRITCWVIVHVQCT